MARNRPEILDTSFVGDAKKELAATIAEQQKLKVRTSYRDLAHNIKLVFYSPEGLSIQLVDSVRYDVEVYKEDRSFGVEHVHTRYIAVLTPTESRWKVRVFQGNLQ